MIQINKFTSYFQINVESAHIIAECHTPTSRGFFYDVIPVQVSLPDDDQAVKI